MSKIKIGVLGVGRLGRTHLKLLQGISNYELVGFYDPDDANAEKAIGENPQNAVQNRNFKRFSSLEELIDAVDVVDVVTPTVSHFKCASLALKKFKHVFIEKPLAHTLPEAKELIALAHEANVKAQVGHVERFNPAFLAASPYLKNPLFIETHRLAQFDPRGTDVSVVLDLMIHDIDIVLSVVKANVKKISASGVAVVSDTPDIANARIEFDNGCVANITASRISLKKMRKSRFFQRDAYISVDFLEKETEVVRLNQVEEEENPLAMIIDLGVKGKKIIHFENPSVEAINSIAHELKLFSEAIINNTTPPVTLEDGFHALSVAHKIIEKLNRNLMV